MVLKLGEPSMKLEQESKRRKCKPSPETLREAAPDMYVALISIRHWLLFTETLADPSKLYLEAFVKANNLANEAIAKAEGRTL